MPTVRAYTDNVPEQRINPSNEATEADLFAINGHIAGNFAMRPLVLRECK